MPTYAVLYGNVRPVGEKDFGQIGMIPMKGTMDERSLAKFILMIYIGTTLN